MSEVVHFSEFRFNSLRKFMAPVYALMQKQIGKPSEEKKQIVSATLPKFYERMRLYRQMSLEDVAATSKVPLADFEAFESGSLQVNREIEEGYCKACHGHQEREYFAHQIYAFYHPSVRESTLAMAKDVFIRFGLTSPYVDYQNLNTPRGKVLELKR